MCAASANAALATKKVGQERDHLLDPRIALVPHLEPEGQVVVLTGHNRHERTNNERKQPQSS